MEKVLITGTSCGVGRAAAIKFLDQGYEVVGLDWKESTIVHSNYKHYVCDVGNKEELPNIKYGILSGPSHAEEVSLDIPTALVIASENDELKEAVIDVFKSSTMRLYTSKDVRGVELGAALKNIIAFCAGVSVGLELGDNTFAALATRGLVEITRLGTAMGGEEKTFYGLTGLGDLIVTCTSMHSRNRKAGMLIGQGKTLEEAKQIEAEQEKNKPTVSVNAITCSMLSY